MRTIDEIIAASSIGEGLRDIAERGVEAHVADRETAAPKAKRKKGTSPTARTLAELRKRGWIAGVVEQFVRFPPPGHKVDLFGVIDIVAIVPPRQEEQSGMVVERWPGAILAIQATAGAGGDHARRRTKILAEPRAKAWVEAGGRLELWSWALRGAAGKAKRWTLRVETYAEMVAAASEGA